MTARFPLPRRTRAAAARRFRPSVLALEGRDLPSTLTVTNLLDSGVGSLRAEIAAAAASGDTIAFAASVRGTITLTSGELLLNKNLTITGPGANLLTVSGNGNSRVFEVAAGKTDHITGLTIARGFTLGPTGVGGGILNAGTLTLARCTVSGNTAQGLGYFNPDGSVGADGFGEGGGIASTGALTISACTVSDNRAEGDAGVLFSHTGSRFTSAFGYGGGVYSTGTLTVTASTFVNNTLTGFHATSEAGGGVYGTGTMALTDSTFTGNGGGSGNGIYVGGGTTTLTSCTVTGNGMYGSPTPSGGVSTASGAIARLRNTIIARNPVIPFAQLGGRLDIDGPFVSLGYNLIGVVTDRTGWQASDLTGTPSAPLDPMLQPLANNGGPTQTMALMPASPAVGAGDPALAGGTDQRGVTRRNPPSIGAYEYNPTTFTVTTLADSGVGSLRDALTRAVDNDIIAFAPALSGGTIAITTGELQLRYSLTVQGLGLANLAVSGNNASRLFEVMAGANVTLSGLTVTGGKVTGAAAHGGGILNHGTLTLSGCAVTGNTAVSADPNGQSQGGGIYNDASGTLTLTGSSVDGNLAYATGGGTSSTGSANGGGLYSPGGTVTLTGCDVSGNYAYADGGGLRPAWGGGLTADGGTLIVNACTVNGNGAFGTAGATGSGGGLHVYNTRAVQITNTTLDGNAATSGGGLSVYFGSVQLQGCTLAYNYATGSGGGVAVEGAQSSLAGSADLTNCTLAYNYAGADGGGAYVEQGPDSGGQLDCASCTLAYNYAGGSGGGVAVGDLSATYFHNTIVARNGAGVAGPDASGVFLSGGYNLIGITDGSSGWTSTDLTGTAANPLDPMLGDLADNGGPTQTIALLAGSPAIGAGDGTSSTDQRGVARHNPSCIGAYEF